MKDDAVDFNLHTVVTLIFMLELIWNIPYLQHYTFVTKSVYQFFFFFKREKWQKRNKKVVIIKSYTFG